MIILRWSIELMSSKSGGEEFERSTGRILDAGACLQRCFSNRCSSASLGTNMISCIESYAS